MINRIISNISSGLTFSGKAGVGHFLLFTTFDSNDMAWHGLTSSGNELHCFFPWRSLGMNYTVHSLKKSGHVRPCRDVFRERTEFFPWRSHCRPDIALTSSGNKLCSLFPEDRSCQAIMNFSGNEPHSSFLEKVRPEEILEISVSCQRYRTASFPLLVVWVFYHFLTRVFKRLNFRVACRYGLAFILVLA